MVPYAELIEKIRACYAVAIPSISEVAPNSVIDAIRCGVPFILTKYSGYAEKYKDMGIIIDPLSQVDMMMRSRPSPILRRTNDCARTLPHMSICERMTTLRAKCSRLLLWDLRSPTYKNNMRLLQIGSDRSKRGILFPRTPAFERQRSYADVFGHLDIVGFSLRSDGAAEFDQGNLSVHPTNSFSKLFYGLDALHIVRTLQKPDVISVQDPFEVGLLGLLIARRFHIPLHVQVHTDFLSPDYARLSFINRLRTVVAGFVLRRAARIRVVSERVKNEIIARYGLKTHISVLPIFVDVERFRHRGSTSILRRVSRIL